ncbi:MAG: hypothetical protein LBB21_03330, partial [Holosporaceae bacterium]|nr:hypothetical protein [Holosporaceae bacterium]
MKKTMVLSVALLLACTAARALDDLSIWEKQAMKYLQENHKHIADTIERNKNTMPIYLEKEIKRLLLLVDNNQAILKQLENLVRNTTPLCVDSLKKKFNIDVYTTAGTIRDFDLLEPSAMAAIDKSNPEIVRMLNGRPNDLGQYVENYLRNLIHDQKIKAISALLEEISKNKPAPAAAQYSEDEDSEEEMILHTENENLGQNVEHIEEDDEDDNDDYYNDDDYYYDEQGNLQIACLNKQEDPNTLMKGYLKKQAYPSTLMRVYLNQQAKQALHTEQEAIELYKMQNTENCQNEIERRQEFLRQLEIERQQDFERLLKIENQQELKHQQELQRKLQRKQEIERLRKQELER